MILTALARLGRDAELRHTPGGDSVCNLALAVNYGRKGDDGNRPTQWLDASLWGKRAEALAAHLTKGKMVYVVIEEPHTETFEGKNGTGAKLVGRVLNIEFAGGNAASDAPQKPPRPQQSGGFGDFDSDIPF